MNTTASATLSVQPAAERRMTFPLRVTMLYLIFEYARPQDVIPGVGALHLPLILLVVLAWCTFSSGRPVLEDPPTQRFVILLLLMIGHIPFATNTYWAFHTWRGMLANFVAYVAIANLFDDYSNYRKLISVWIAIHVFLAVYGLGHAGQGVAGFISDENDLSLVLDMALPFSYFLFLSSRSMAQRIFHAVAMLLFLLGIMATFSRGGFIGLVAVVLYAWLRSPRKILSTLLIAACVLIAVQFAPEGYWDEMNTIKGEVTGEIQGTGQGREYEWRIGWRMFLDNPVFGVGQGNFPWRFADYEGEDRWNERSLAGRAAHSLYFTVIPELGIVGVLIFGSMAYLLFSHIRSARRTVRSAGRAFPADEAAEVLALTCAFEGAAVAFFVSGAFISVTYYPPFWFLLGFVVALQKAVAQHAQA